MNNHLSEDQITEWILGARDELVLRHLEICEICSGEAQELLNSISNFRDSIHAAAQREPGFWKSQELALREKASATNWYPLHWAWALAMVVVLIAVIFLTRTQNPPQNYSSEDADKALLQEIQGDLARQVPEALTPAVLIAQERNEILTNEVNQQTRTTPKRRRQLK